MGAGYPQNGVVTSTDAGGVGCVSVLKCHRREPSMTDGKTASERSVEEGEDRGVFAAKDDHDFEMNANQLKIGT
jgi:hypothetical protein